MKKTINYVLLLALLIALVPIGKASAATGVPNFFLPDNGVLFSTANITMSDPTYFRNNALITESSTLTVTGTFQQVAANSLSVTVDQVSYNSASTNLNKFDPIQGKSFTASAVGLNGKFTAKNLKLFAGYNRLTFSGTQNGVNKQDVFYVVYDASPQLKNLKLTSGSQTYDWNEGVQLVVTTSAIAIQGNAGNANFVYFNGQKTSVSPSGDFYATTVRLTPGLNDFKIDLEGDTDTVRVNRQVYFYDPNHPFTKVDVTVGAQTQPILGNLATITDPATSASLHLQFLVPDSGQQFFTNLTHTITVNGSTYGYANPAAPAPNAVKETVITNTYGQTSYRLIDIYTTPNFPLLADNTPAGAMNNNMAATQPVSVSINYATSSSAAQLLGDVFSFNLASGKTIINNVWLLPNYKGTAKDIKTEAAVALDGSNLTSPDFYILVKGSISNIRSLGLNATLLPFNNPLTISTVPAAITYGPSATDDKSYNVYQVTGLPEGNQKLSFSFASNPPSYKANVSYVTKNYVSVDSIYDGQIFQFKGGSSNTVSFSGKIIGFAQRLNGTPQLIINNKDVTTSYFFGALPVKNTADDNYDFPQGGAVANLPVNQSSGPLYYGQNDIQIQLDYKDANTGVIRHYTKSFKIFIVDTNTPNVSDLRPLTAPTTSRGLLNDPVASNYLPPSPEFQFNSTFFTTTLDKMDLFVEGTGATSMQIKLGQTTLYDIDVNTTPNSFSPGNTRKTFLTSTCTGSCNKLGSFSSSDYFGDTSDFKVRLNDVLLPVLGTHVFTITMTNANGATATKTLEIHRENIPMNILSPRANTGNDIVVNKNYVLFDVEAIGATEVQVNGIKANPRGDIPDRFTYTVTGLKGDTDNKIKVVAKRASGDVTKTISVKYVTDPNVGSMYMESMGTKHSVFNKGLQLALPKNDVLRRVIDGKIQPQTNLLFGIADPTNGNTELINDYGQKVGTAIDSRTQNGSGVVAIGGPLISQFSQSTLPGQFTRVSPYYWISAGLGEQSVAGASDYKPATGGLPPYSTEGTFKGYPNGDNRLVKPTQRGTLTLQFNANVVDQAGTETTVFFLGNNNQWKNIGGLVDVKNHTITVPFDDFGYYMVSKLRYGFDDITNHGWARNIMQATFAKGYMDASTNNAFGVNDYVSRGEFASMLVRALAIPLNYDNNPSFEVDPNAVFKTWTYAELETAARAGIVQGFADHVFQPLLSLSRQDAAVMIARAVDLTLAANDSKLDSKLSKAFADGSAINHYAMPAVDALNSSGIMVGSPATSSTAPKAKPEINFNPTANLTRAEEAQILVRLLQKYVKAFPTNLS